jgi:hypothetical protein
MLHLKYITHFIHFDHSTIMIFSDLTRKDTISLQPKFTNNKPIAYIVQIKYHHISAHINTYLEKQYQHIQRLLQTYLEVAVGRARATGEETTRGGSGATAEENDEEGGVSPNC